MIGVVVYTGLCDTLFAICDILYVNFDTLMWYVIILYMMCDTLYAISVIHCMWLWCIVWDMWNIVWYVIHCMWYIACDMWCIVCDIIVCDMHCMWYVKHCVICDALYLMCDTVVWYAVVSFTRNALLNLENRGTCSCEVSVLMFTIIWAVQSVYSTVYSQCFTVQYSVQSVYNTV